MYVIYFAKRYLWCVHYTKNSHFLSVKKNIFHRIGGLEWKPETFNPKYSVHIMGWYTRYEFISLKFYNFNKICSICTKAHSSIALFYLLSLSNWVHAWKVGLVYWVRLPRTCTVQNSKPAMRQKAIDREIGKKNWQEKGVNGYEEGWRGSRENLQ